MSTQRSPKVAGIEPPIAAATHNAPPGQRADPGPADRTAAAQDSLASRLSDLTTLHELTEQLAGARTLEAALHEVLRAGAALAGARRGLLVLEPADGSGPEHTVGLGLGPAEIGTIETVPRGAASCGRVLDGLPRQGGAAPGGPGEGPGHGTETYGPEAAHPDLLNEPGLDPRHREVAARLGFAASYAAPIATEAAGRLGSVVWLYDEPAEPAERERRLLGLYLRHATGHLARRLELARARRTAETLREGLLPGRLPRTAGVRLAVRHRSSPAGGGDWYDALALPEGALGLSVGGVTGSGPGTAAAMGRLRSALRAYAVTEGEDPVAVLSDLELLLRLTEPARSATALFAYCVPGPARHRVVLAGAGHCPPLLLGRRGAEYIETTLSAPLGMLSAWEAPSVVVEPELGETLLLYTDGLLRRTGEPVDQAFERLRSAAASVPAHLYDDPDGIAGHVLRTVLPDGRRGRAQDRPADDPEDVVLLVARFE